ncbi:MAG: sugar-binding transcriptional regulator [Bauldia litoralis]
MVAARDQEAIIRIARMRYEEKRSQQEIARHLGVSTSTVSRSLRQAMALGFVEIRVVPQSTRRNDYERLLQERFGLETVIVVASGNEESATLETLGRAVADYLMTLLRPDAVIGVSDGRTTAAVARHVRRTDLSGIEVVPLIGGVGGAKLPTHPYEVALTLAHGLGVANRPLPVPAAVDSEETAAALLASPIVRTAFEVIARCDVALVGVGTISKDAAIVRHGVVSAEDMETARTQLKAAGTVCARFYDSKGASIPSWIDSRMLTVTLEQLKAVPWRLGVAIGAGKVSAMKAAVDGGLFNVLGTDEQTAAALL